MQYYNVLAGNTLCVTGIIGPTFVSDWPYLNLVETYYFYYSTFVT